MAAGAKHRPLLRGLLMATALIAASAGFDIPLFAHAAGPDHLVISQVYGGGGNASAIYQNDFVELFNPTASAVDLSGLSVQYASSTGTGNFGANDGQLTPLSGTLEPGHYYLIQEWSAAAVGAPLPTADLVDGTPINLSGSAGKVALVASTTSLGCNGGSAACTETQLALVIDRVGYGGANFFEGSAPTGVLSNITAASRVGGGYGDTDDNAADFVVGTPYPRNSGSASPASHLVISQVYGGGGNASATYRNDFVELFNPTASAVDLSGLSVQYASATGTGNFGIASQVTALSGTLEPGRYYLIQEASGGAVGAFLPTPNLTDPTPIDLSGTNGKVALVTGTDSLGCNGGSTPCTTEQLSRVIDRVGYGSANFSETTATGALSSSTAAIRLDGGYRDTDVNAADFAVATPTPRSSAPDVAPTVVATSPANGATGVAPEGNLQITFSEPVNVTTGWYQILCGDATQTAAVSGGPTVFTLNPDTDLPSGASCTVTVTATAVTDQDGTADAMAANYTFGFTVATLTPIDAIQGASHTSPLVGQSVMTTGVVTALRDGSPGFFLQDPTPADSDPATSEGIFVYTGSSPTVAVGDRVRVTGTVIEYRSSTPRLTLTQLGSAPTVTVLGSGEALPAPVVLGTGGRIPPTSVIEDDASGDVETGGTFDPANDGIDFYESLEGMRVQVNDALAVGPTHDFGSNREIAVVSDNGGDASTLTPRGGVVISDGDLNPERIILNDYLTGGPDLPQTNVGDTFAGATVGVVDYTFGNFKLQVSTLPTRTPGGLAPEETELSSGTNALSVATFNAENLAPGDPTKLARLATQIVTSLKAPDLLAVEEIQDNNGSTDDGTVDASSTVTALIDAIVAAGGPTYAYRQINPVDNADGGAPGGNIRQVFLFRTDHGLGFVDRAGGDSTTATTVSTGPQLTYSPGRIDPTNSAFTDSRKPLAAEFTYHGHRLFVIANHFNSKGGDDPLFGHHQPPTLSTESQRIAQATLVHDFVAGILAQDAGADVVVLGDLNDFQFSTPITTLTGSGPDQILTDLVDTLPANERYTYVYDGNSEVLDHILISADLATRGAVYDAVHVNSEFADQASDHDPQVALLSLNDPPTADAGGPYNVYAGDSVTVSATGGDLENGPLTYAWDLDNNGTFETPGQSAEFSAASITAPATRTIGVQVTDDGGLTATATATVNVVADAVLVLDPRSLSFGQVPIGTSTERVVVVYNTGTDPLVVTGLHATNPAFSAAFAVDTPVTIPAGGATGLAVTFTPSTPGLVMGNIEITDNGAGSPHQLVVSGSGQAQADLGVAVNAATGKGKTAVLTYTVTLANHGPADATGVQLVDTLPATVTFTSLAAPAGASCTSPPVGSTGSVVCTFASYAVAASPVTLTITVKPPSRGTVSNTVSVSAASYDPVGANNTATVTTGGGRK